MLTVAKAKAMAEDIAKKTAELNNLLLGAANLGMTSHVSSTEHLS